MRALNAEFELSDTAQVLAGAWNGGMRQGSKSAEWGSIPGIARKYKNRGNEAKKYLKKKDITFLNDAKYARFACKFAAICPQKEQESPHFARTKLGLASPKARP